MTLVKLQRTMSNEIAKRAFFSRPPEPPAWALVHDPLKSIYLGTTKIFRVPFAWSYANITNPHIAVVGITGSGKSYLVKSLLTRASYIWNTNAVIIDWAGEYNAWVTRAGGTVVSLGKGSYLNLMDLYNMKPLDRAKQIMNALDILTDIGQYPEQVRLTEEAIEQAYLNAGFELSEIAPAGADAPTLVNVITLLQEKLQEGTYQYPAELENAIYRLRQFAREGEDYFARKSTLDIGKLASSGIVGIDLSHLPDERFRALAALFILQTLKELMRSEGWLESRGLKTFVVLDEAWKVASDEKSDAITIIREGRKYQFGLIVASQNPTDVNEAILSNVGTSIILRIKFEKFINYLQGSLNFSDFIKTEIGKFGVGQAAVDMAFSTSLNFPETFLLEKVHGEEPLHVYTLVLEGVLTNAETEAAGAAASYEFESDELKNLLIAYGLSNDSADRVLVLMDDRGRRMPMWELLSVAGEQGMRATDALAFLKSFGMDDMLISRIMAKAGVSHG